MLLHSAGVQHHPSRIYFFAVVTTSARFVGIVRSWTQVTEFSSFLV
jgi:hypothetical protein